MSPFLLLSLFSPPLALDAAPLADVAVVLGQGAGEDVATGAVGDEVEFLGRRRVQGGADRGDGRAAQEAGGFG